MPFHVACPQTRCVPAHDAAGPFSPSSPSLLRRVRCALSVACATHRLAVCTCANGPGGAAAGPPGGSTLDGEALDSQAVALWALWSRPHALPARPHPSAVSSEPPLVARYSLAVLGDQALVRPFDCFGVPPPLWLRDHRPAALSLPPLPSRRCACCLPVPHMSRRRWRTAGGGWVTPQRWLVQRPQQCPKHGARGQATGGPGGALPPPCTPSLPRRGSAARRQGRRQGAPRRRQPCQWRSRPVTTQLRKQCSRRLRRHLHRRLPSCSGRHLGRRRRACRSCWTISTRCCCPPGS